MRLNEIDNKPPSGLQEDGSFVVDDDIVLVIKEEDKKGGNGSSGWEHSGEKIILGRVIDSIKSLTHALKQTAGESQYRKDLSGLIYSGWRGDISGPQFLRVLKYQLIPLAFEQAWKEGARVAGIQGDELTREERDALRERIREEQTYARGLRDYVYSHDKSTGTKLGAFEYRIDLWVNRYRDVASEAAMMAGGDKKYRFQYNPEKENCTSCRKLNGQVRRMSFWKEHDCRPQHSDLECMSSANGPTVCGCEFVETDEACTNGPLPRWRA